MATRFEMYLHHTSPYKDTRLYVKDGRAFFGRWNPSPLEITGREREVVVQQGQEGQLDLFAYKYYGDRRLWRIIAQANKIDLPFRDVVAGMKLIIPSYSDVQAALTRSNARPGEDL